MPLTPGSVPSSPTPSPAQVTLGRPARPPHCSGVPLQKELEGVASGSLQAPRCQDFLSQWMGTQETQGPRLVLFGVSVRLEKCAVSTGSGPSCGPAPGSVTPGGFSWEPKTQHCPESPARPRSCLSLSLHHYVPMTCFCLPAATRWNAKPSGAGAARTEPSLYPQRQAQG